MWQLKITRVNNGYQLYSPPQSKEEIAEERVIEDNDEDELKSHEDLLWFIMEYFNFGGSKHDKERLRITREKQ